MLHTHEHSSIVVTFTSRIKPLPLTPKTCRSMRLQQDAPIMDAFVIFHIAPLQGSAYCLLSTLPYLKEEIADD